MSKATLAQCSPFFEQMFSLPQPIDTASHQDDLPVIPLAEQAEVDRKSTRLNSSHSGESRMPSSA